MFAFLRHWQGQSWADSSRVPASLGLFAGVPAGSEVLGDDFFCELPEPRWRPRGTWRVARSPGGMPVLLSGWIDNIAELRGLLGLGGASAAQVYGAAVERWGDEADRRIVGEYAALVCLGDGEVRLSRAPWGGKSLFFVADGDAIAAASIPRPLFAMGVPKRLRGAAIDALLAMDHPDETLADFEGIETVPHGTVMVLGRSNRRTLRWYDPLAIPAIRLRRDEDYVEAAREKLGEAVACAMAMPGRHGASLSGGLDSSLVCAEMLRQLPPGARLPSFTFHPLAQWDGSVPPHKFGDDRPWVEQFARMHPALDPVFVDNRDIALDDRAERLFLACDAGYPARVAGSVYHGVLDAARDAGCDWLFSADMGNLTFSNTAIWAYGEFLRRGRWGQLWQLAASRIGDPRPIWRRIAAHALMPQLPGALRCAIRSMIHGAQAGQRFANPFLRAEGRLGHQRSETAQGHNIMLVDREESRAAYIASNYRSEGLGAHVGHGYEQVFGLRLRDVTAYRPLIEFCLGLPTGQFVRDGETRWLARRMALGRLPEAQRRNRLYGEHNVDWHARLTPRLPELRRQVAALARNPMLAEVVDTGAMLAAIDAWPARTPRDPAEASRLQFFLPAVLYIAAYLDFETGRNSA